MKNPTLAFFYSLAVPGLGQLYLGERAKGWTLLSMTGGVAVSLVISHTWIAWLLMGGIYLAVMIPAALDAYQTASGRPRAFTVPIPINRSEAEIGAVQVTLHGKKSKTWTGESIPYVIVMLLMIGPFAIPLLWQSGRFSKTAKVSWTLAVILIALLAIAIMTLTASSLDQLMEQATGG